MAQNMGETHLPDMIQGTEYRRISFYRQDTGQIIQGITPEREDTGTSWG